MSPAHKARLAALIDDATAKGARAITLGESDAPARVLAPTLLVGVDDTMAVMREEIFGPLLPIETYRDAAEAIARINSRPHPLAFYFFGDRHEADVALRATRAGGATIGDTLWHFAHEDLPFGGVGASGIGAYHGEAGFLTFTHSKPVFVQPRVAAARLRVRNAT